jgi:hypothetical protein
MHEAGDAGLAADIAHAIISQPGSLITSQIGSYAAEGWQYASTLTASMTVASPLRYCHWACRHLNPPDTAASEATIMIAAVAMIPTGQLTHGGERPDACAGVSLSGNLWDAVRR